MSKKVDFSKIIQHENYDADEARHYGRRAQLKTQKEMNRADRMKSKVNLKKFHFDND